MLILLQNLFYLGDNVTVLRVHHGDSADLFAHLERLNQLRISEHKHIGVRHEHLEATDTVIFRQRRHILFDLQRNGTSKRDE